MSEIKPVVRFGTRRLTPEGTTEMWGNIIDDAEVEEDSLLYPAAAIEALQKELGYSKMAADEEAKFADEYKAKFEAQVKQIAHQQYLIDSLMIEFCPDEMTTEQWENWKAHQRKVEL